MNTYYTYAYLREDGTPYYIGKGKGRRAFRRSRFGVSVPPQERIKLLVENTTEEWALFIEMYLIDKWGRLNDGTGILENFTDGGEGISGYKHTTETKEHFRNLYTGREAHPNTLEAVRRPKSRKTKDKMSKAAQGRTGSLSGRKHINNGTQTKAIPVGDPIPDGWFLGKHYRPTKTNNGRFWVTNGVENKFLFNGTAIPDGYKRGRTC